jgi:hypothetical protein
MAQASSGVMLSPNGYFVRVFFSCIRTVIMVESLKSNITLSRRDIHGDVQLFALFIREFCGLPGYQV